MSLRSTVNRTTGYTANMLQLGRELRMPWDVVFMGHKPNATTDNTDEYVKLQLERLHKAFKSARQNIRQAQVLQKKGYDGRSALKEISFQVGDLVYTINTSVPVGHSAKLQPIMKGPFIVTEVLSPSLYVVKDRKKSYVLHHDRLLLCEDRVVPLWVQKARKYVLEQGECGSPPDHTDGAESTTFNLHEFFENVGEDAHNTEEEVHFAAQLHDTEAVEPQIIVAPLDDTVEEGPQQSTVAEGPQQSTVAERPRQSTRRGRQVVTPQRLRDYVL